MEVLSSCKNIISKTVLNGKALVFALVIVLFSSLVSGLFIMVSERKNSEMNERLAYEQAVRNVKSGIVILSENQDVVLDKNNYSINNENEVTIEKELWGLFSIGKVESLVKSSLLPDTLKACFILGAKADISRNSALYLTDKNTALTLSGNTKIIGDAQLPKAGVKKGNLEGQAYMNDKLIYGNQTLSDVILPAINKNRFESIFNYYLSDFDATPFLEQENISFTSPLSIHRAKKMQLSRVHLKGHIMLIANQEIVVDSSAILEDVILIAPKIKFKKGFKGNVQAYAFNSIETEKKCHFNYPSILAVLNKDDSDEDKFLILGTENSFAGSIFAYSLKYNPKDTKVIIEENTTIMGQIHADGELTLKGDVTGCVTVNSFSLKTTSGTYKNNLLNATIDRNSLSEDFLFPLTGREEEQQKILKWVERY